MATLTQLNAGVDRRLRLYLNGPSVPTVGNLTADLYLNNHAPVVTDTLSSFVLAVAEPGYSSQPVDGSLATGGVSGGVADYIPPSVVFTFTSYMSPGDTVYGVVLSDPDGNAVEAGLLDTPYIIPLGGGTVTVDLEFKEQQCAPPI